jgi:endoglucanase
MNALSPTSTVIPVPLTETAMPPTFAPETAISLQRGLNLGNMLEAPNEGEWGLYMQEEYFDLIREAGFDFVRLPVRWSAHAATSAPYAIDTEFMARVDEIVEWALTRDLILILDFHHYEEIMVDPQTHRDRYLGIWRQLAFHYKDHPSSILFELLNEPNNALNSALWNEYSSDGLKIIRESNPTRDVIFGPINWNAYDQVATLDIPDDPHLIVTFHYYLPFEFTHQGAEWIGDESNAWLGTTWDGTEAQKAEITRNFDLVAEWAQQNDVRILLGEFGAYSKAPHDSRLRWTEFVSREAERHGFAWSYWEFASGFGVYDPNAAIWREDLLKALIP